MKDKTIAALLALFLGMFGVHRFYLGQVKLGILYVVLALTGISMLLSLIDFFVFLIMDKSVFDVKYNKDFVELQRRRRHPDFDRYEYDRKRDRHRSDRDYRRRTDAAHRTTASAREQKDYHAVNPYKASGIQRYKEYDYEEAIEDFNKALQTTPNDIAVHFNLACAHSLLEQKDEAFHHLNRTLELGFKDYKRIQNHDALAYIRTQPEYEAMEQRVFAHQQLRPQTFFDTPDKPPMPDLLDQIKQLGELREKGLLTEEEFAVQKKKLLGWAMAKLFIVRY